MSTNEIPIRSRASLRQRVEWTPSQATSPMVIQLRRGGGLEEGSNPSRKMVTPLSRSYDDIGVGPPSPSKTAFSVSRKTSTSGASLRSSTASVLRPVPEVDTPKKLMTPTSSFRRPGLINDSSLSSIFGENARERTDTSSSFIALSSEDKEQRQRQTIQRDTIRRGFFIALERVRNCLQFTPISEDVDPESEGDLKRDFRRAVRTLHNEVFTAAGYIPWLKRNFPPQEAKKEVAEFRGLNQRPSRLVDMKFKDLILRETIWTVAEHIRHCPQRINQLFHIFKKTTDNTTWYKKKMTDLFLHNRQDEISNLVPPYIDLYTVHDGIDQFKNGDLNFDDINECGKWNERKLFKTFYEPPGALLFFLILKYCSGMIQFKLWNVAFVFFLYKFGNPLSFSLLGDTLYQFPALTGFILLDFFLLVFLLINDWILRLTVTRQRRFRSMPVLLRIKLALYSLQPFLAATGVLIVVFAFQDGQNRSWLKAVESIAFFYISGRAGICLVLELFPFSPTITLEGTLGNKANKKCWQFKGLRTRYIARVAFFLLLTGLSMLYEWLLIVPTLDSLLVNIYCGEKDFTFIITEWDTQQLICISSTAFLFMVTVFSVAIDNGLAFITAMAFVGWIRGYKTQGTQRSVIQIFQKDLIKKLTQRFIYNARSMPSNPVAESSNKEYMQIPEYTGSAVYTKDNHKSQTILENLSEEDKRKAEESAKRLWIWSCDYWRDLDLISDKERDYLLQSQDIDCTLLHSPDAQKHISFFISTLTVEPVHNYSFMEIPPTSILIPCFAERLEFDWNPKANYSPHAEFYHMIAKYPDEWLNLVERLQRQIKDLDSNLHELEAHVLNVSDLRKDDPLIQASVTEWLSLHDQYVEKTVQGCCDYYLALVQLAIHQGGLSEERAHIYARKKMQVIICMQIYQRRYREVAPTLARWMKDLPCLQVVIDYERTDNMPEEFNQIPSRYKYATCLLEWDRTAGRVVYRHILPRENPLRICNKEKQYVQGKSMNQVNGMTFAFGRFVQVLDANQGGHATEYLKFPSLLREFRLHPQTGDIRYRIIGSREYIFTKNLGTVARCHAYQEWSFGTLVLRTYSDLGIRLHYGHPDVFHGPWASAHSGLSKVNPDINTSEDVFAGFMVMACYENTKHVEHIQFQKGRETGLANMTLFDIKISQGNAGILRSRDMYHLMERLDYIASFLLFQGVSGHFTTISLMMCSMKLYIILLFLVSLSGASLKAMGGLTYSTEWLFHAGLTTIVPLVVEFLVEYGPVIGLLQSLFFLPVSTMIYLFQMQTKHEAFTKGIFTGKATHISTGRGLAIYRSTMVDLFMNYGQTHIFPILYIIVISIAYKGISTDLGGGTLPLIMIYFLCAAILLSPTIFNPTLHGGTLQDVTLDVFNFMVWIGKTENRLFLNELPGLEQQRSHNSLLAHMIVLDYENLPTQLGTAWRSVLYHITLFIFWIGVAGFLMYPPMQFWLLFYTGFWSLTIVCYCAIFYLFQQYEQPLRIIVIYLGSLSGMLYFLITFGNYGILNFAEMYIPFLVLVKILETLRALVCDCCVISSFTRYKASPSDQISEADAMEMRQKYVILMMHVSNKIFFVNAGRILFALVWGVISYVMAVLLRPFVSNVFLFGKNANTKTFAFLKPLRKFRLKQQKFGVKI